MKNSRTRRALLSGAAALAITVASGGVAWAQNGMSDYDWSGGYVGLDLGYGAGNFVGCEECADSIIDAATLNLNGLAGGFHAGFNHQMNNLVLGVEGDVMFTGWTDHNEPPNDEAQTGRIDLLASLRARAGVATDHSLLYLTGGVAFGQASWEAEHFHSGGFSDSTTYNSIGGVVGGGGEFMVAEDISLRIEGLYYLFNDAHDVSGFHSGGAGEHVDFKDAFVVRAGVTVHFP